MKFVCYMSKINQDLSKRKCGTFQVSSIIYDPEMGRDRYSGRSRSSSWGYWGDRKQPRGIEHGYPWLYCGWVTLTLLMPYCWHFNICWWTTPSCSMGSGLLSWEASMRHIYMKPCSSTFLSRDTPFCKFWCYNTKIPPAYLSLHVCLGL